MTDTDIADQLCRDQGFTFESDNSEITHQEIVQFNCSDWDFMLCRAEGNGFWVTTEKGKKVGTETLVNHFFAHKDIASLTATSRQTVTSILNELREQNLIYLRLLSIMDLKKQIENPRLIFYQDCLI